MEIPAEVEPSAPLARKWRLIQAVAAAFRLVR
jgi:hypothetical protein